MGDAILRFQPQKFSCLLIVVLLYFLGLSTGAWSQISVTTFHNDNSRTGQNAQETVLTPANVNSAQFGKLFTISVDGYVFAQPLYLAGVQNIAGGTHNVLYIVTQHGSLFAIDADTGAILWQKSFINPAAGINTVSPSDVSCTDILPESSITSTPVIDPSSGTLYLLVKTNENGQFFHRLHAIGVASGAEKFGGPVTIAATVNGTGDHGETVTFNPLTEHNRPGLLLENGHIVMGWASYCDNPPYHGWVMSYSASTLAQEAVLNLSPNGTFAGVWMSGDGIAADANGNYYLASGNGSYNPASGNYGDSILQLGPAANGTLPVLDSFTPWNQNSLSGEDSDVGSAGLLLLPDLPAGSTHQHLVVQMGKEGTIYLIDRDNMGGYCSTCIDTDTQIVQEINNASIGVWGSPAYWNGNVYWASNSNGTTSNLPSNLMAFSFNANNSGLLSTAPTSQSSNTFNFGTGTPVVSANGNNDGIVWLLDNSTFHADCCQVLYAFDATNLGNMLYNSSQAAAKRDVPGAAVKFTAPVVANGKVYVGSQFQVSAYGLINPTATTVISNVNPAYLTQNVAYTASVTATGQPATPTGSATFYQGTTALGTVPLTDGQATYSTTYSAAGAFRITATFTGTPGTNFVTSTSPLLQQVVHALPATTVTKLTSSASSIFVGQTVTFTATVSSTFGMPPNGEIVTFKSGGVAFGTGTLTGGVATFTTSTLVAANHVLLASYAGDADFAASQSPTITLPVSKYSTTTALTSAPNPSSLSQPVTLTAHVTSGASTLSGSITFRNGTTSLGIATITSGVATLTTKTLPLGANQLTAAYSGDASNLTSTSPSLAQNVTQAVSTTTALTSTLNPAYVTQTVTYTATVTAQSGTPTGSVTFKQGSAALTTVPLSSGHASYSTTYSAGGAFLITAAYSPAPGANFAVSTSPALKEVVHALPAATTTTLKTSASSIFIGQTVTLTATVSSTFGTPPNGETVTFKSGGVAIGTGSLTSGVATFTTSTLVAANHVLLATYPGDANFAGSQSPTVTLPVSKYPTTTALGSTPNPSSSGQAVTLTAQATTTGPSTPTGSVAFLNGTTTLGTVTLNSSGIATLTTKLLPIGANQLTAKYNGSATSSTSVSPAVTQTVN